MKNLIFVTGALILGCYAAKAFATTSDKQHSQREPSPAPAPTGTNPNFSPSQSAEPAPSATNTMADQQAPVRPTQGLG